MDQTRIAALAAGVKQFREELERTESAGLKMHLMPTATAQAVRDYIGELEKWIGGAVEAHRLSLAVADMRENIGKLPEVPMFSASQSQAVPSELASLAIVGYRIDYADGRRSTTYSQELVAKSIADNNGGTVEALVRLSDVQSLFSHSAATGKTRPTDDELWDATIRDRDTYHDWADRLAEAISKHFGAYIGEHSNTNCPWAEALEAIESASPAAPLAGKAEPTFLKSQHKMIERAIIGLRDGWATRKDADDAITALAAFAPLAAAVSAEEASLTAEQMTDLFHVIACKNGIETISVNGKTEDDNKLVMTLAELFHVLSGGDAPAEPAPIQESAERIEQLESVVRCSVDDLERIHLALGLPADDPIDAEVMVEHIARLSKPTAQGTAEPASLDASIEKLEKVARWINKLPVPTDGATTNYCRVHDVIVELRRHIAAQAPADRDAVLDEVADKIDAMNDSEGDRAAYENRDMFCCEEARMWALKDCADGVRALKSQPAASHGAVEGEQNEGGEHA